MITFFSYFSIIGQDQVEADRYCVKRNRIYDFDSGKLLKKKEALELLRPCPKAYNYYEKSTKQYRMGLISGIAIVGFGTYLGFSDEVKNGSYRRGWSTTTRAMAIGFVTSSFICSVSLTIANINRQKSFKEFGAYIENNSSSYNEYGPVEKSIVEILINPTNIGLSYTF